MQQYFIGVGSIKLLPEELRTRGVKSIFLVRDADAYEISGAADAIRQNFNAFEMAEFADFAKNPQYEDVEKGLRLFLEKAYDCILTIGGGSVIDMAKLISYYAAEKNASKQYPPIYAVPTTAGTGSEATHFAVMYINGIKHSIADEHILPEIAVVDPQFTYSSPPYLAACAGIDALAQAIESYWNVYANDESLGYAEKALALLYPNLYKAVALNDKEAKNRVAEGAYWAGRAINSTKTTAPHAISYPFTIHYGYPHGHAVALTLPYFMAYNYAKDASVLRKSVDNLLHKQRMERLYALLGIASVEEACAVMKKYIARLGLDMKLPANFEAEIVLSEINEERLANNPAILSKKELKKYFDSGLDCAG